jgi:DNA-binding NtrC family response regulator
LSSPALLLEDDRLSRKALARLVEREGFDPVPASTLEEARAALHEVRPDVLLIDVDLPDGSGLDLLEELEDHPDADIVIVSGAATLDDAVQAMREGAVDVLGKPVDSRKLRRRLATARRDARRRQRRRTVDAPDDEDGSLARLTGDSPAIGRVRELVGRVAPTRATVLVTGETGTGKELVARAVHELGPRSDGPFVPLNCGAVAPTLIESELFGHERGAFTGATRGRRGAFERATGGTLFLDEITEMSPELQVRLLRALETREIVRIGGDGAVHVDVRIVAATNRAPEDAVRAGKLREDLFFRLDVFRIDVPPLRERGGDVEQLAERFLEERNAAEGTTKRLVSPALDKIRAHDWPGNVRELRNAVERAFIIGGDEIGPQHVALGAREKAVGAAHGLRIAVGMPIAEAERRLLLATLEELNGDKRRAARMLGISLKTLYNRLNDYARAGSSV